MCRRSFWVALLLNYESPNYTMLINLFVPIVVSTFWLVFPQWNPAPSNTPLWSVLPSLFMSLVGVVLWKLWERDTSLDPRASIDGAVPLRTAVTMVSASL